MADKKAWTTAELAELGRKTLEQRKKSQESSSERNKVKSQLYKALKDGKIKLPA